MIKPPPAEKDEITNKHISMSTHNLVSVGSSIQSGPELLQCSPRVRMEKLPVPSSGLGSEKTSQRHTVAGDKVLSNGQGKKHLKREINKGRLIRFFQDPRKAKTIAP